jgi:outer membrane protein insertion porin family
LRGYDDYQVVPDKYNRLVPNIINRTVADTASNGDITHRLVQDTLGFVRVRYPGGRYMASYSIEQQFAIYHPLHCVLFFDAGNTWDLWSEVQPLNLKLGAGIGFRLEIPFLGNIGFDFGYGFNRDDGPRARGHFLIGNF